MLHGNQEESRQEKETLIADDARPEIPRASRKKHLSGGFSVAAGHWQENQGQAKIAVSWTSLQF